MRNRHDTAGEERHGNAGSITANLIALTILVSAAMGVPDLILLLRQ